MVLQVLRAMEGFFQELSLPGYFQGVEFLFIGTPNYNSNLYGMVLVAPFTSFPPPLRMIPRRSNFKRLHYTNELAGDKGT